MPPRTRNEHLQNLENLKIHSYTINDQIYREYFRPEDKPKIESHALEVVHFSNDVQKTIIHNSRYFLPLNLGWVTINLAIYRKYQKTINAKMLKPIFIMNSIITPLCIYFGWVGYKRGEVKEKIAELSATLSKDDLELFRKFQNLWILEKDARLKALMDNTLFNVEKCQNSPEYKRKIREATIWKVYNKNDQTPIRQIVENSFKQMELLNENQPSEMYGQNYQPNQEYQDQQFDDGQGNMQDQAYGQGDNYNQWPDQNLASGVAVQKPQEEEDPYVRMMKESAERTNRRSKKWDN